MLAVSLQRPWQLSKSPVTFGGVKLKPSHRALGRKGAKGAVPGVFWVWISEGTAKIYGGWVKTFKEFAQRNKMSTSFEVLEVVNAVISCSSWFVFGLPKMLIVPFLQYEALAASVSWKRKLQSVPRRALVKSWAKRAYGERQHSGWREAICT